MRPDSERRTPPESMSTNATHSIASQSWGHQHLKVVVWGLFVALFLIASACTSVQRDTSNSASRNNHPSLPDEFWVKDVVLALPTNECSELSTEEFTKVVQRLVLQKNEIEGTERLEVPGDGTFPRSIYVWHPGTKTLHVTHTGSVDGDSFSTLQWIGGDWVRTSFSWKR